MFRWLRRSSLPIFYERTNSGHEYFTTQRPIRRQTFDRPVAASSPSSSGLCSEPSRPSAHRRRRDQPAPPPPPPPPSPRRARSQYVPMAQNDTRRQSRYDLVAENERLHMLNQEQQTEIRVLNTELEDLRATNEELVAERSRPQPRRRTRDNARIADLETEIERQASENEKVCRRLRRERDNWKTESERLQAEDTNLRNMSARWREELLTAKGEVSRLRRERDEAQRVVGEVGVIRDGLFLKARDWEKRSTQLALRIEYLEDLLRRRARGEL